MNDAATLFALQPLAQQAVFRQLMRAFSYPGRLQDLDIGGGAAPGSALRHVLAALVDGEVTLADPDGLLDADTLTLLEARRASPETAHFVVADGAEAPRFTPSLGTLESPERGATVVLAVADLGNGDDALHLTGPGVDGTATLRVRGLDPAWLAARSDWNAGFPLGVDLILVDARRVAALPRTTRTGATAFEGEH